MSERVAAHIMLNPGAHDVPVIRDSVLHGKSRRVQEKKERRLRQQRVHLAGRKHPADDIPHDDWE